MATNIALANVSLPAHLANIVGSSVLDDAVSGLSAGGGFPRISIKGARFRIIEDGAEQTLQTLALQAVIVGANRALSKEFYEEWDAENPSAPLCFSDDGIAPDAASSVPQSDRCATCPKAQWGSKITPQGKETKACADLKRLAIVSADDITGTVYEVTVKPSALSGFNAYARDLKARRIPAEAAITTLSFDDKASFPKLCFNFGGFLSAEDYTAACEVARSEHVKDVVRQKDIPVQAPAPVAAPKKPATPAPAPKVEPTPEPVAPAPKAKGFGKAATPPATPAAVEKVVNPTPAPAAPAPKKAAPKPVVEPTADIDISDFEAELQAFSAGGVADDAE